MGSRVALASACLVLVFAGAARPLHAKEPAYFTLSGGWSWPEAGPVKDSHESGFTVAGSFRTPGGPNYLYGLEVGYSQFSLDSAALAERNPGSTFSGGDLGLLSVTTENDYVLGVPGSAARPFLNLGIGYFASFIDDVTVNGTAASGSGTTGVYEGSFFGFHGGAGLLINQNRFGLRLDANYQYLFAAGDDLGFLTARGGIIFYPSKK